MPGRFSPQDTDPFPAVLKTGDQHASLYWVPDDATKLEANRKLFQWYRYLFLTRSKPASHLSALGRLKDEDLLGTDPMLLRMIDRIQLELEK